MGYWIQIVTIIWNTSKEVKGVCTVLKNCQQMSAYSCKRQKQLRGVFWTSLCISKLRSPTKGLLLCSVLAVPSWLGSSGQRSPMLFLGSVGAILLIWDSAPECSYYHFPHLFNLLFQPLVLFELLVFLFNVAVTRHFYIYRYCFSSVICRPPQCSVCLAISSLTLWT